MDFMKEIERKLDLPAAEKAQVLRELRSHHEELRDKLIASGLDAAQAEQEAAQRLGDPEDVAARLRTVHCRATWKSALLAAFPFAGLALIWAVWTATVGIGVTDGWLQVTLLPLVAACLGLLMISGSVRELVLGRRPIWLATWLATAYLALRDVSRMVLIANVGNHQLMHTRSVLFYGIEILVLGAATWAFRKSPKWRNFYLVLTLLDLGIKPFMNSIHDPTPVVLLITQELVISSAIMGLALKLFAWHPYGNIAQSSLFLCVLFAPTSLRYLHYQAACALLMVILAGVTVLIFARACTWQRKLVVLSAGLLAMVMIHWLEFARQRTDWLASCVWLSVAVAHGMVLLVWVVLVPMFFERLRRGRRPEFAR